MSAMVRARDAASLIGVDQLDDGLEVVAQRLDQLGPQRLRLAGLPSRDAVLHHLVRVRLRVRLRVRVRVRVGVKAGGEGGG